MVEKTPVLIVGAGPVGLALAGDLGWRGVGCTLIEKTDGHIDQPKMDMVGVRTMEFCRRWGIVEWVEQSPYPRDYLQDCVWVTSLTGHEFGREPFPTKNDEKKPPQSPQKRERCPQDMFDPILRRNVAKYPTSQVCYETELVSFQEKADYVLATLRDVRTGKERVVQADYMVGADGGASEVRKALGIDMTGNAVLTYTTNVIFRCPDLLKMHDKGQAYRFIFIGPNGTWLTIVAINGADRWRMSVVGTEEKKAFTEEELRALIVKAVGREFDFEILSVMPWIRRELVANSFGTKRVFIAGDAAHLMSPTGGFGMNTGIGDAVDLAWKLEGALSGWGGKNLLASYDAERRPIAQRNVNEASTNLKRMLSPRNRKPPAEAFEEGPEAAKARKEYGDWFTELMRPEWFSIGVHLGYVYHNSPIVVGDGSVPIEEPVSQYTQSTVPGARAPHVWLKDGRSTLDNYGRGFTLLRIGNDAPGCDGIVSAAKARKVPLQVIEIAEPDVQKAYEKPLVLVRPDGHIAWRGENEPYDAAALIDTVRGA